MTGLDVFTFAGHAVRTKVIDGDPCILLADIIGALELRSTPGQVAQRLPEGVRRTDTLPTAGGPQRAVFVTEAGLYRVVLRSDSPHAEPFVEFVTEEVLPQIARTGSYAPAPALPPVPRTYAEALRAAADAAERAEAAEQQVAQLEPPARAWEGLASGAGDYTVSDAAKILQRGGVDTGPRRLYGYLAKDARWIFHRGGRWQAMQHAVERGWMVERITSGYFDQDGERRQGDPQIRVTARGIERLLDLMAPAARALEVVR